MDNDAVQHPSHYTNQVPGIECIQVVQHFNFNRGNIIKYTWRCGDKGDPVQDLQKVIKYAEFEIERLKAPQCVHFEKQGFPGLNPVEIVQHFNFNRGNIILNAWNHVSSEALAAVIMFATLEIARIKAAQVKIPVESVE